MGGSYFFLFSFMISHEFVSMGTSHVRHQMPITNLCFTFWSRLIYWSAGVFQLEAVLATVCVLIAIVVSHAWWRNSWQIWNPCRRREYGVTGYNWSVVWKGECGINLLTISVWYTCVYKLLLSPSLQFVINAYPCTMLICYIMWCCSHG